MDCYHQRRFGDHNTHKMEHAMVLKSCDSLRSYQQTPPPRNRSVSPKPSKREAIRVSAAFNHKNGLSDLNRDLIVRLLGGLPDKRKIRVVVGISREYYNWIKCRYFKLLRYRLSFIVFSLFFFLFSFFLNMAGYVRNFPSDQGGKLVLEYPLVRIFSFGLCLY
jgi:hypothetical protein